MFPLDESALVMEFIKYPIKIKTKDKIAEISTFSQSEEANKPIAKQARPYSQNPNNPT
jgi:hypothetical protein